MKYILATISIIFGILSYSLAENRGIGDTIHAIHYDIHLNEVNTSNKTIEGFTEVKLVPLVEFTNYIPLELKYLTVDSVVIEGYNMCCG